VVVITPRRPAVIASLALLVLLSASPFLQVFPQQGTGQAALSSPSLQPTLGTWPPAVASLFGGQRTQFGLAFWGLSNFAALTSGSTTVAAYEDALQKYFLPHNIYWVTTYQSNDASFLGPCINQMCPSQDFNNLLTAGDALGMHFLIWFPSWGFSAKSEPTCTADNGPVPWQHEVLNYWAPSNPASIAEVGPNGNAVCVLRSDYVSLWEKQIHADILADVKNYGSHPSFAGFEQYWELSLIHI